MNEELIRQCAWDSANGPHGYAHEIAERAIRLYHARHVAPLERENEALKLLLSATEATATDHSRTIIEMRANVAPLVEAVEALGAMPEGFCFCSQERVGDDSKEHEVECADVREALAPSQKEGK